MTTINRFLFFLKTPPCVALWSITNYLTIWSASSQQLLPPCAQPSCCYASSPQSRSIFKELLTVTCSLSCLFSLHTHTCSHLKSDTVQNKKTRQKKSSSRLNQRKFHSGRCGSIKSRKYFPLCINGSILSSFI